MTREEALIRGIRTLVARWDAGGAGEEVLVAYALELERWNRRINLIRFRDWAELCERHLVDGFAAARHLPSEARSVVDVGAGAGIPGALIAALRPDLELVALEPIHKKHAFLRSLRRSVPLRNFTPYAARLGGRDEPARLKELFDVAISRATWSVPEWIRRGRELVVPGGLVLAMEGRERAELPDGAKRHRYAAGDRERAIIAVPAGAEPGGSRDA